MGSHEQFIKVSVSASLLKLVFCFYMGVNVDVEDGRCSCHVENDPQSREVFFDPFFDIEILNVGVCSLVTCSRFDHFSLLKLAKVHGHKEGWV